MDFMLDDGAFVESSINCPTKGNLHISDLQLSYLSLSPRSASEMLICKKWMTIYFVDGRIILLNWYTQNAF